MVLVHGNDSVQAMSTLDLKAVALMELGRFAEAKLIHEELLEFYSKHYAKADPLVLKTKYNIGYGLFLEANL